MNVVEFSIAGNSEQETTEQNDNFLIFEDRKQEIDGVTVSFENGVITLNGTATNGINLDIPIKDLLKTDTYRFTILQESGSRSDNIGFLLRDSNTDENLITINGSGGTTYLLENDTYCYFRIWIPKNNQISNIVYKCMLSKGEEGKTWVEGTPNSPSPPYPSEVETVGDNVNIFDKDTMRMTKAFLNYDTTAKENFKLITAGSDDYICYIVPLPKNIRDFTISAETFGNRGVVCGFSEYPELNMEADQFFRSNTIKGSCTANADINYIMLFVCNDGVEPVNLKIEPGTEASAYSSYNMGCASVIVGDKNVFSFEKAEKLATYAMPSYEVIDNNSIELKNSADWAYIQYQYILKKNTQYTISYDLEFEGAENVAQWWTTIEDSLGSIATDFVTLVNNKYIKTFTTREDMIVKIKLFASTPINPALTIIKNIQIEEGNTATEYIPHLEQTKVVDIQKPMLQGDYLVKEEDGWKEVHGWNKQVLDGTEAGWSVSATDTSGINRFANEIISTVVKKVDSPSDVAELLSNRFIAVSANQTYDKTEGASINANGTLYIFCNACSSMDKTEFVDWLTENPLYIWYKLATPTKLACTEKQSAQLDDLLNTSTYKNVTHIYSTDKVSPVIKVVYKKDLETMLNNQQSEYETRLSNIEKLLSTTTTSALLLDNLQEDIKKEVM